MILKGDYKSKKIISQMYFIGSFGYSVSPLEIYFYRKERTKVLQRDILVSNNY